jgi:hypothetical protein
MKFETTKQGKSKYRLHQGHHPRHHQPWQLPVSVNVEKKIRNNTSVTQAKSCYSVNQS